MDAPKPKEVFAAGAQPSMVKYLFKACVSLFLVVPLMTALFALFVSVVGTCLIIAVAAAMIFAIVAWLGFLVIAVALNVWEQIEKRLS